MYLQLEKSIGSEFDSIYHNAGKKGMWNTMIKHCILFGIAIFSNQFWYIAVIIDLTQELYKVPSFELMEEYMSRSVGIVIDIVILSLVLKINSDKYILFCKCCHLRVLKYCMKLNRDVLEEGFGDNNNFDRRISTSYDDGPNLMITSKSDGSKLKRLLNNDDSFVEGVHLFVTMSQDKDNE